MIFQRLPNFVENVLKVFEHHWSYLRRTILACFDFIRTRVRTVLKSPWIFFDFECSGIARKLLFLDFDILFLCKATLNSESPGAEAANREKLRRKVMEVQASNVISQKQIDQHLFLLIFKSWCSCASYMYNVFLSAFHALLVFQQKGMEGKCFFKMLCGCPRQNVNHSSVK